MLFGAMNFPVRPILQELETVAGLGFDYLELTMDPPQAHHTVIREQRDEILSALDRAGLQLVCHLPTFISTADLTLGLREASVKEVLDSLDLCAELKPLKVVLHPSYMTGLAGLVSDRAKQHGLQSLSVIVERCERLGITVCIENMFPRAGMLVEPEDFAEVFGMFPSLLLTLDLGHANIGAGGDKRNLEFLHRFADRLGHVHASDNFGKEDNHLPIGAGNMDFRLIVKRLVSAGYNDTVTLEVFSRDKDYLRISREKLSAMFADP